MLYDISLYIVIIVSAEMEELKHGISSFRYDVLNQLCSHNKNVVLVSSKLEELSERIDKLVVSNKRD